jgi:hypothetical protein
MHAPGPARTVARPRVLLASATITPTKPLTPSHLKNLFWLDVLYKATALVADISYPYNLLTANLTAQTLGFWEYLDRVNGDAGYAAYGEEQIGELYVRYQAEPKRAPFPLLRPYLSAAESGWMHPSARRITDIWAGHYALLGLHDPGLGAPAPLEIGLAELIERLRARNLCLDCRPYGGPLYLDATAHGLPLRQIVTADGQPNYLAGALRQLVPLAPDYDETILACDADVAQDYLLLERVLTEFGAKVHRLVLGRVPIDGVVQSSRHGGWQRYTVPRLAQAARPAASDLTAFRLGMRCYFVGVLGRGQGQSFRLDRLCQAVTRAGRLLADTVEAAASTELTGFVRRFTGHRAHVDPYRLTTALLTRGRPAPVHDLVKAVYG